MPENKERSDEEISEKPDEIKKDNNDHPVSKTDEKKSSDDKSDNKKTPLKKKRNKKKTKKDKPDKDTSDKEKSDKDDSEQQNSNDESDAENTDKKESDDKKSDEDKSDKKKKKKKKKKHRLSKLALKAAEKAAVYTAVQTEKAAKDAVNSNYRNTSAISNTGAKSVELTKKTAKTTVKTAKTTVKTVKKTIKAIKNAPENLRKAVKNTKRAVKATVKVVKATVKAVKATVKVIAKLLAWLSNPVVFLIVLAIAVIAYIIFAFSGVLSTAAAGEATTKRAYSQAAGLGDVPKEFQQGLQVLKKCKDDRKKAYDQWIDTHLYYDDNNMRESNLVYMVKYDKNNQATEVKTQLACKDQKDAIKNVFTWDSAVDDAEILSIAYVLEQKSKNEITPEAEYKIHTVTYTEDIINKVLDKVVEWKNSHTNDHQYCPERKCCWKWVDTQAYIDAKEARDKLVEALNNWNNNVVAKYGYMNATYPTDAHARDEYWRNEIQPSIDKWKRSYENNRIYGTLNPNTGNNGVDFYNKIYSAYSDWYDKAEYMDPKQERQYWCDGQHKLYSDVLEFFNKEQIMNMLSFNDTDKYWQQLTEQYLRTFSASTNP